MSELRRIGDLDLNEDLEHERREGRLQSIGWVAVALLLGAALSGAFGGGALSSQVAGQQGSDIRVEYERFERRHRESRLQVHLAPTAARDGVARLWISRGFLDSVSVDGMHPEPRDRVLSADRIVYAFPMSSRPDASAVTLLFRPEKVGPLKSSVGIVNGPELHLWQFIYP
ncbi:MAG TPA: hypothetical protein VES20_18005 [Bryobacteraceae bacterium]|nr:hypothetical protein [Bryobacteraceae bacterium]